MLPFLLSALVVFLINIKDGSSYCSGTTNLIASNTELILEQQKNTNLNCEWTIDSTNHVEINVTEWSLDSDQDSLSIYDGSSAGSMLLAKLDGAGSAMILISSKPVMHLLFQTGHTLSGKGFRMSYRLYPNDMPRCEKLINEYPKRYYLKATDVHQTITSKNYPQNYPVNEREEWVIIKPSASSTLAIIVEDLDIEDSRYCGFDSLNIYNGKCSTGKKIAKLCGTETGSYTISGNQHVLIRFVSDTGATSRGFKLKYYLGTTEDADVDTSTFHAILIGIIAACTVVIFLLASAKLYMRCFQNQKVRPNQSNLQNRRAMLEAQIRRGPNGSRLNRIMTAQSIHAEMTRYLSNSTTSDHDSRVSTFEISTSQSSGQGLVYHNGMFKPPSYSALFNHEEETFEPSAPPDDTAPPPYPGSPVQKEFPDGQAQLSAKHDKEQNDLADVETIRPPPYQSI